MSMIREEDLDLAAGFALGALDDAEQRRAQARLANGDVEFERLVREFGETSTLLAYALPAAKPSGAMRSRVLDAARGVAPAMPAPAPQPPQQGRVLAMPPRRERATFAWGWAAAAVAAALAIVSVVNWQASQRVAGELRAARAELGQMQSRLDEQKRFAAVFSAPGARFVQLGATKDGDTKLIAKVTYDPLSQSAVMVVENFVAPSGKDYELWAIRGGKPASLGLIRAGADGRAMMRLENVGDPKELAAFAVSLEPSGGAPTPDAPSGPVVMVGKVSG